MFAFPVDVVTAARCGALLVVGSALLYLAWLRGLRRSHHRRGRVEVEALRQEIEFALLILQGDAAAPPTGWSGPKSAPTTTLRPGIWRPTEYPAARSARKIDLIEMAQSTMARLSAAEVRVATDPLTGLATKQVTGDALRRMVAQAGRAEEPMAVVMVDLDHFKDINDRFGHPVGDRVLARVGAALRMAVRSSDLAGRNGGEEFAVLLPDTDLAGALKAAEKIRTAIASIHFLDVTASVTASVGVAVYPEHSSCPDELEQLADSAMYRAKRAGRNQVGVAALATTSVA